MIISNLQQSEKKFIFFKKKLDFCGKIYYIVVMIKIEKNENISRFWNVFAFGKFVKEVEGRAKAYNYAKALAKKNQQKFLLDHRKRVIEAWHIRDFNLYYITMDNIEKIRLAVENAKQGIALAPKFASLQEELQEELQAEELVLNHGLLQASDDDIREEHASLDAVEHDTDEVDYDMDENEVDMTALSPAMREIFGEWKHYQDATSRKLLSVGLCLDKRGR